MTDSITEQRINIKFCAKLGKSPSETLLMLSQVYGDACLKRSTVYEWHKRFKEGREDVHDDDRSGRPVTHRTDETVDSVCALVKSDRRLSIRMMADELHLSRETVRKILTEDLLMRKISAKMVPKILTDEQKERRVQVCVDLSTRIEEDSDLVSKIVTGDETWCYQYDPETKRQSMQWCSQSSPRPRKARMSRSQIKTMLVCFFDIQGIVHREFVEQGSTVNQFKYLEILKRLREAVRRKRPHLWSGGWILHHDNAPAHAALRVHEFLASKSIATLDHPPYSPDLAPCDFWLFPKLKIALKGQRFDDITAIQQEANTILRNIPNEEFKNCFEQWKHRMAKCVSENGQYFENF